MRKSEIPNIEIEYRDARYTIQWQMLFGPFKWYVSGITMPWQRGTLLYTSRDGAWFAFTKRGMVRKCNRVIDREYRRRKRKGQPTAIRFQP